MKWLTDITLSSEEAKGPWQRGMAYKGFGPSTKTIEGIDVEAIPSLQEQPVQSAIMTPKNGSLFNPGPNLIQGYAYSGGGRGIVRVDVSSDAGKNWVTANLRSGKEQPMDRAWAWTFWDCVVDIPDTTLEKSTIQVTVTALYCAVRVNQSQTRSHLTSPLHYFISLLPARPTRSSARPQTRPITSNLKL